jgi:hypothetical protein
VTVDDLLANWRRWCLSTDDCYPAGYPPQCSVERVALPYRVLIDEDEALEQIEATREPDARWAELCERWVQPELVSAEDPMTEAKKNQFQIGAQFLPVQASHTRCCTNTWERESEELVVINHLPCPSLVQLSLL